MLAGGNAFDCFRSLDRVLAERREVILEMELSLRSCYDIVPRDLFKVKAQFECTPHECRETLKKITVKIEQRKYRPRKFITDILINFNAALHAKVSRFNFSNNRRDSKALNKNETSHHSARHLQQ